MGRRKGGVAFFDSGIGGMTVLHECRKWLPGVTFYYYGDNQHAPYGNLHSKKIKKYVFRVFKRFQKLHVWAVVVACNTATAVCIEELRRKFPFPIIGAEPAVLPAARKEGEVFVLMTRATYESSRFQALCQNAERTFPNSRLSLFPCDTLAGEIEKHVMESCFDYTYLLPRGRPAVVVLGCTHYVYIKKQIENYYHCPVIDGNRGIACRLRAVLEEKCASNVHLQPLDGHFQPFSSPNKLTKKKNMEKIGRKMGDGKGKRKAFLQARGGRKKSDNCIKNKGIIFLGGYGEHNKSIYEHLFGWFYG